MLLCLSKINSMLARAALLQAIHLVYGTKPRLAVEMIRDVEAGVVIPRGKKPIDGVLNPNLQNLKGAIEAYIGGGKWPNSQHLGRKFGCDQDQITDGLVLRAIPNAHLKTNEWLVEEIG